MMTKEQVLTDINKIEDNGTNTALEVRTVLTDLLDFSNEGITANSQEITTLNSNIDNLTTRVVKLETNDAIQDDTITKLTKEITNIGNDIDGINQDLALIGKPFYFWNEFPVKDQIGNYLWYSFQGFQRKSVNFTFKIKIIANDDQPGLDHNFILDDELVSILEKILYDFPNGSDRLSFVVSAKNNMNVGNVSTINKIFVTTLDLFQDDATNKKGIVFNFTSLEGIDKGFLALGDEVFTSIQFHCPKFNFDVK